jgi:hypothetical protein
MKFTWEAKDIRGGRMIVKPDAGPAGRWVMATFDGPQTFQWLMVCLGDGYSIPIDGGKDGFAAYLNSAGHYQPSALE